MIDKRAKIEFLDTLLATRRQYSMEDIMQRFEKEFNKTLSRRSFFYYIQELKSSGAPLEYRTEKNDFGNITYYFYEESFNLSNTPLNRYDTLKIKSALNVLKQLEYLPQMEDLEEVILKLEQQINSNQPSQTLLFEHRPHSSGIHWLRLLHDCITEQKVLKIKYQPFPNDEKDLERWLGAEAEIYFHPYFLKESKNLWYIFGLNHAKNKIENYALDRIQVVETASNIFFKPNKSIDSATYFDDIIGVTQFSDKDVETFLIKANNIMAPYCINRPLHTSQTIIEQTPQYTLFSYTLRWNYEWQNLILSYGAHLEVLQPQWFRESIGDIYKQAASIY